MSTHSIPSRPSPSQLRSRLRQLWPILTIAVLALVLAGCRGQAATTSGAGGTTQQSGPYMGLQITPHPHTVGPAEVTVELKDANDAPIENATIQVEGNMSHAGMVPVISEAHAIGSGRYVTRDFEFTMGGDWFIIVTATLPNGERISQQFDVKGVTSDSPSDEHDDHADEQQHQASGH